MTEIEHITASKVLHAMFVYTIKRGRNTWHVWHHEESLEDLTQQVAYQYTKLHDVAVLFMVACSMNHTRFGYTVAVRGRMMRDDKGKLLTFDTVAKAEHWIKVHLTVHLLKHL